MDTSLPALVREKLVPVLTRHGFEVTSEDEWCVEMTSPQLHVRAAFDPRGELDVVVYPIGLHTWEGWSYTGMIGRASLDRLMELAAEQMQSDPRILEGDPDFLAECARDRGRRPRKLP